MKSRVLLTSLIVVAALSAPTAFAATRYVSPTGRNFIGVDSAGQLVPNDCLSTDPCETIQVAVVIAQPGDIISVAKGRYVENVTVANQNLTIEGAGIDLLFAGPVGTFVDGNKQGSVFDIQSGFHATIRSMTIANGITGIANAGDLDVEHVAVEFNGQVGSSTGGFGIDNNGTLSLTRVDLLWNRVGLRNSGTVNAMNESFAIFNVEDGIRNETGGKLDVSNSLILGNWALGVVNHGQLDMLNVTIGGNWIRGLEAYANTSLNYVTLTANGVESKISGMGLSTTGILTDGSSVTFANSLVYGNGPAGYKQCDSVGQVAANKDGGYNVFSDASCVDISKTSKSGVYPDPKAATAWTYDQKGRTGVYPLQQGSPAIDLVPNNNCVARDQRGVIRPVPAGGNCDAGAYEYP